MNTRYVLIVGSGPRGQAFAAKLEDHRELGLRSPASSDDETYELPRGWRTLGRLDEIEAILHDRVVDEVVICLPFSQWDKVDAISQIAEDEGKIVRVPMDVIGRAFSQGRMEELDGTPVFSLVNGPDRAIGLALKRAIDIAGSIAALIVLQPGVRAGRDRDPSQRRRAGALPPGSGRAPRAAVRGPEVPDDDDRCRGPLRRGRGPARYEGRGLQDDERPAGHVGRAGSCAARASTSCRSSERAPRRDEPGRAPSGAAARGRGLRPVASPAAVDEARDHRSLAGVRARDG